MLEHCVFSGFSTLQRVQRYVTLDTRAEIPEVAFSRDMKYIGTCPFGLPTMRYTVTGKWSVLAMPVTHLVQVLATAGMTPEKTTSLQDFHCRISFGFVLGICPCVPAFPAPTWSLKPSS